MNDLPTRPCRECGAECRAVPIHRDGRVDVEGYYCTQDECRLYNRNQLHYGTPGFRETEFRVDGSVRHTAFGRPDQNEANTMPTCEVFVAALRREFEMSIDGVELVDHVEHPGVDARARWTEGGHLRMQVTRALPREDYHAQAQEGEIERTRTLSDTVELLRSVIETKTERTKRLTDISDITLLIDGRQAADLAFPIAPATFRSVHGTWAADQGWESIWTVGSSFAKRLDLRGDASNQGLPHAWPLT